MFSAYFVYNFIIYNFLKQTLYGSNWQSFFFPSLFNVLHHFALLTNDVMRVGMINMKVSIMFLQKLFKGDRVGVRYLFF